jgi:integrase
MASINYLYRSKKDQASLKVRLLFRYNGKDHQLETDSKIVVTHDYWAQYHRKSKIKDVIIRNKQREIQDSLNSLDQSIIESFYKSDPKYVDKAWLISTVETHYKHGEDFKSEYLTDIANDYIESIMLNASKATITKHNTIIGKIEDMQTHYKRKFKASDVDSSFKALFNDYYELHGYNKNTIKKNFKFIKTYCYYARDNGIEINQNLKKLSISGEDTKDIYLTLDELELIKTFTGLSDKLDNVRDWLLISCFTAQRISDFSRFGKDMIIELENQKLISFKQTKGQKEIVIPLLPEVQEVLDKRDGEFPRKISDQRFNQYVKELCKTIGFKEEIEGSIIKNIGDDKDKRYRKVKGTYPKYMLVSSHIGRRSFATNFYGKIPTPLLMSATGHTTEKQFLEYIKIAEVDSALELAKRYLELR